MGTVTFLFADIVGSTRLWDTHPEAMRAALGEHDALARKIVTANNGDIFKHTGDGFIAAFRAAAGAVSAAVEYQRLLGERTFPDVGPLTTRIGVHTGEVEERDNDYFGPALNRASRLQAAAHGGQVLVSVVTQRMAATPDGVTYLDLGEHRLRDLSQPERVYQAVADGLTTDFPELRTTDLVPNNLPTIGSSFVGREQEMEEIAKLVRGARVVTISGVGGAGKTRLALQVAAEMGAAFPGGVWLVELASVTDAAQVDNEVARALGVVEVSGQGMRDLILDYLAERHALVILDNCEHLLDAAASLADALVGRAPDVKIMTTSRELLGVAGEVAYGLRSLSLPREDDEVSPAALLRFDAIQLFLERAAATKPDYRMSAADAGFIAEICQRLDGMPLALELAAARLRSFSPRQIADNLDKRFRLLTGGSRTALPRQQTLAAAIDWSYRLLTGPEMSLFQRLSVFQGGFTLESAMAVCSDAEAVDEFEILELLPALVDKSLVVAETGGDEARYTLLETIRQFARDRLDESGTGEAYRLRHAEHFLELGREAGRNIRGPDEALWWERIGTELDNLRQAMTWGLESDNSVLALRIAESFWRYWWFNSVWSEGIGWLIKTVKAAESTATKLDLAGGLLGWGTLRGWAPHHEGDSVELLTRAVELYRELDAEGVDREVLKRTYSAALINLSALMEITEGPSAATTELNEEALAVARRLGDAAGVAVSLGNLAEAASRSGDEDKARALFVEAIEASKALRSQQRLVEANWQVGGSELKFGNPGLARQAFTSALDSAIADNRQVPIDVCRVYLAVCDIDEDLPEGGATFREAVRTQFSHSEMQSNMVSLHICVVVAADVALIEGRFEDGAALLGASEALTEAGTVVWHEFLPRRDRVEERLRQLLGPEFEAAKERGLGWSPAEMIDVITG